MKATYYEIQLIFEDPNKPRKAIREVDKDALVKLISDTVGFGHAMVLDSIDCTGPAVVVRIFHTKETIEETGGWNRNASHMKGFAQTVGQLFTDKVVAVGYYGYSSKPGEQNSVCLWFWSYNNEDGMIFVWSLPEVLQHNLAEGYAPDHGRIVLDFLIRNANKTVEDVLHSM
jgi:hypothetical protein